MRPSHFFTFRLSKDCLRQISRDNRTRGLSFEIKFREAIGRKNPGRFPIVCKRLGRTVGAHADRLRQIIFGFEKIFQNTAGRRDAVYLLRRAAFQSLCGFVNIAYLRPLFGADVPIIEIGERKGLFRRVGYARDGNMYPEPLAVYAPFV